MVYIISYIINGVIFGLITKYVAQSKGYEGGFWWGFFLGLIGLLVVGFRPNIEQQTGISWSDSRISTTTVKEQYDRNILDKGGWKCDCGMVNFDYVSTCGCGRNKREVLAKRKEIEEKTKNENNSQYETAKSAAEQIKEFKELCDNGIITSEEFEAKKKQLLGL